MQIRRRDVCILGVGAPLLASMTVFKGIRASDCGPSDGRSADGYCPSLVNDLTPKRIEWDGRRWSADMGSTWHAGMKHCFQSTRNKARFELRPTPFDRAPDDNEKKRRSELHCSTERLENGVPLWGAISFIHHAWQNPEGMAKGWGGVHGQIHMGRFGGSPAVAFRRLRDGRFAVSTRGEFDPKGTRRWAGPLSFGQVHDLVYRVLIHPHDGQLDVWLDGHRIVSEKNASIGSGIGGSYWCLGAYYSGGIANPVVAEFGNHEFPTKRDLTPRIAGASPWPMA